MAGRIVRGEVRLCKFPPPDKERPVIILTRDSAVDYLARITVAPVTSTLRGVPSELVLDESDGLKHLSVANLFNVITVPKQALGKRVGELTPERLKELCVALRFAMGCD